MQNSEQIQNRLVLELGRGKKFYKAARKAK